MQLGAVKINKYARLDDGSFIVRHDMNGHSRKDRSAKLPCVVANQQMHRVSVFLDVSKPPNRVPKDVVRLIIIHG